MYKRSLVALAILAATSCLSTVNAATIFGFKLPQLSLPKIQMPKIPKMQLPKRAVCVAEITVPRFEDIIESIKASASLAEAFVVAQAARGADVAKAYAATTVQCAMKNKCAAVTAVAVTGLAAYCVYKALKKSKNPTQ